MTNYILETEMRQTSRRYMGKMHTSTPPMQKRTTKRSMNQVDISLYSKTKKHEAMTTNKTADIVLISTTSLILAPFRLETSTVASYYTREIYHYQPRLLKQRSQVQSIKSKTENRPSTTCLVRKLLL